MLHPPVVGPDRTRPRLSLRPSLRWLLLFVLLPALPGCAPDPERSPDVVLVVIDTLRADRLEAYGHGESTGPVLDRLAREGTLYERVVAPSSWTKTSMASVMTARNPLRHGVMREGSVLPGDLTTLARAFRDAGYQTIGINANPWLVERYGFADGFHLYESLLDPSRGFVSAPALTRRALAAVRDTHPTAPLFLYVHYMDVHAPYSWHDEPPRPRVVVPGEGALPDALLEQRYRKQGLEGPAVRARILALYDAGVRAADAAVGELLQGLSDARPDAPRIVAVTSDHGEGFREHGTTEHGWNLYPEVYAVPLILAGPGVPAALRVPGQVRSIDLAPTLLQLAGAAVPASFDGEPLPLSAAAGVENRTAVSSLGFGGYVPDHHYVAVVSGTHLYIHERTRGTRELYDLETDPGAREPLDPADPAAARHAAIERELELHDAEVQALDESTREALRALGYLE